MDGPGRLAGGKRPSDPETKVVEPVAGGEPVAVCRAEEDRSEEPGPAAHDTVRTVSARDPSRAVRRRAAVAGVVACPNSPLRS
jgi:hypothetical protein